MDIHFLCPHCGQSLTVDQQGVGLEVNCPSCSVTVKIPDRIDKPNPPKQVTVPPAKETQSPTLRPSSQSITSGQATAIIVILILGLFVIPFFRSTFTQVAPVPQWEYTIISVPDYSFDRKMNEFGADGWDVVFARRASDGNTYSPTFSYELILKRPKRL